MDKKAYWLWLQELLAQELSQMRLPLCFHPPRRCTQGAR